MVDRLEPRRLMSGAVSAGTVPWATSPMLATFATSALQPAAVTAAQSVVGLTLINADTDQPVAGFDPIPAGATIDFAAVGTRNLNIRANTSPSVVGSVRFAYDANTNFRTENTAVYAFNGNDGNDYAAWTPAAGSHTVKATPYTGANATGTVGTALSVSFTVKDSAANLPVVSVTAADASATEGADGGQFRITRTGSTAAALAVIVVMQGSAANGTDYAQVFSPVTIPAGSASATVNLTPVDDSAVEGNETAVLAVQAGAGYTVSPSAGSATVTIIDNDAAPPDPTQAPFTSPFAVPSAAPIEAENFDVGGEGVAYHDADATNVSGAYRTNVGVDIEPTTDAGGGFAVGHVVAGEWLEFTVNVATAGSYDLGIRFASGSGGGAAHVSVDGANVSGSIALPATGDWQSWTTVVKGGLALPAGQHVLRFTFDSSAQGGDVGNLNWLKLTPTPPPAAPPAWPTSWQTAASAPTPRFESAATVVGGKVFAFGGFKNSNFQVDRTYVSYDPAANKWTSLGTLPVGMAETHLGIATDGSRYVYFMGGFGGDLQTTQTPTQTISNRVYRYDTTTNTWLQIATMPQARGAGTLDLLGNELHYFGGNPADRVTNLGDHFVYHLDTGAWTTAAPMPNPKDHLSSVVLNGKIYAFGGEHGHDQLHQQQMDMQVWDPATNAWTQLASLPLSKSHMEGGSFVLNGKIVMAGGQVDNFQPTANVVAYDPVANSWTTLPSLPAARQGGVVRAIGNQVVMTLGATQTNSPQSNTWIGQLPAVP